MTMLEKRFQIPVAVALAAVLVLVMLFSSGIIDVGSRDFNLYLGSSRSPGVSPLMIVLDSEEVLEAGICFAPAVVDGRGLFRELYFKEPGQVLPSHLAPTGVREERISSYGSSVSRASIGIANSFWSRMEMVVVVDGYAEALRAAPLAGLLNAPLVYGGPDVQPFLQRNEVKSVVSVGAGSYRGVGVLQLDSQESLWSFYIDVLEQVGLETDYIVVAGTGDMCSDAMMPYLSLTSATIAVHRRALVAADDYTTPLSYSQALGYGCGAAGQGERGADPPEFNETVKLEYQRVVNDKAILVDNHIDSAANALLSRGMTPEFLALVGGIDTMPMMYITNPIWYSDANDGNNGEEYVATDSYYGDLDVVLDPALNVPGGYICKGSVGNYEGNNYHFDDPGLYSQELAVGRIVAPNVLDASALLVRSFSWELSATQHSIVSSRACGTASGGASEEQRIMFSQNGIISTRPGVKGFWSPYDLIASHGLGNPARMEDADFIIYNGHGFPDGWFYCWVHANDWEESPDTIRSEDILKLQLRPSVIFSASCLCSALDWPTIWNGSTDERRYSELGNEMYFSLVVLKVGAIAHIGNTEESWGSFLGGQSGGYGAFDLATTYYEYVVAGESLGRAHSNAKEHFIASQSASALPIWQTCFLVNVLYGEPSVTF